MTLFVYVLSGAAAALAGIIIAARLGSRLVQCRARASSSTSSPRWCLAAPACSAAAARSIGTVLGALTVAVIGNGLILAHMSPFLTPIVTGAIILIAIWLNFRLFRAHDGAAEA